jgi:histidine triad (HIT) family protein
MSAASKGCIFCSIAGGAVPADIVLDTPDLVAFLDHRPLFPGHVLLIPRPHVPALADLPANLVGPYFAAAQALADAVERGLHADGTFVAINNRVSQSVPHLHVHVVPRRKGDRLRGFFWPRHAYADASERLATCQAIRAALVR